ncbi:MAG: FecR domain-containing protein [Bacillota bacterium]
MKKIFIYILVSLLVLISANQAFAASGFSLAQGEISGNYLNDALFGECFRNLKIDAVFSEKDQMYHLSGEATINSAVYEMPFGKDGPFVGSDTGTLKIWGSYDPATGGFGGAIDYTAYFNGSRKNENLTNYILVSIGANYSGYASPGDGSVTLTFDGKGGSNNESVSFTVAFAVQGVLPFTEVVTTKLKDSGAAFSDLSGQVEVLIPTGYDANGEPEWDEEAWTFAKLDMPLPEGTRIKTSDRSSVILSFADMTTFVMKPESEIVLSKPEAGAGPFRLLIGNLWVNMKKGIIDGTMDIEMSQAASGIKGTTFVLEDDGETSTLKVIEGTVEFTSKATGKSVIVKGGESTSATKDGLGDIKTFDANAEMADWAEYGAKMPTEGFPLWAIVAIGGGSLLVMGIILVVIMFNKKKRKNIRVSGMSPAYAQSPLQTDPGVYPPNQVEQTTSGSQPIHPSSCAQCGSRMEPNAAFCPSCGKKAN